MSTDFEAQIRAEKAQRARDLALLMRVSPRQLRSVVLDLLRDLDIVAEAGRDHAARNAARPDAWDHGYALGAEAGARAAQHARRSVTNQASFRRRWPKQYACIQSAATRYSPWIEHRSWVGFVESAEASAVMPA